MGYTLGRHLCLLLMVCGPHQECTEWLLIPLHEVGGALSYSFICPPAIPSIWWGIQLWRLGRESPDPYVFLTWWGRGIFYKLCSTQCHSQLQIGVKLGDSVVVIGCQVNEITCTWSAECIIAQSHIYSGFIGKVSTLTHFPFEPHFEDYSFLNQAVKDFEHGLDSILTGSVNTPEPDMFFAEAVVIPSLVSLGFLHLLSTYSDNSRLQLASSIKCCALWYQARALLLPAPQACILLAYKLIHHFPVIWQHLESRLLCHLMALAQRLMSLSTQKILFSDQSCSY